MQVLGINSLPSNNTNFKSAIPTVFWEKAGEKVDLVNDFNLTQRLGKILVRRANGTGANSKQALCERKMVMGLLYNKDRDYHFAYDRVHIPNTQKLAESITGCFYPKKNKTGWLYEKFNPRALFMTGQDYITMKSFGENIGYATKSLNEGKVETAKEKYMKKGRDLGAIPTNDELHVIVEKTKSGGYKILKLDMYPPEGPKSPYAIMGYYK